MPEKLWRLTEADVRGAGRVVRKATNLVLAVTVVKNLTGLTAMTAASLILGRGGSREWGLGEADLRAAVSMLERPLDEAILGQLTGYALGTGWGGAVERHDPLRVMQEEHARTLGKDDR